MIRYVTLFIGMILCCIFHTQAQKEVKGTGYILTQQRETKYFTGIEVSRSILISIVEGELLPITVEADDNLFDYIKTEVSHEILKIYIPDSIDIIKYSVLNVLISIPVLKQLKATTGARIEVFERPHKVDSINIDCSYYANIKCPVSADCIQVRANHSGIVDLKGEAKDLRAVILNHSILDARALKIKNAMLFLSDRARGEVEVTDSIMYQVKEDSRLIFKGSPKVRSSFVSGDSKVVKKE